MLRLLLSASFVTVVAFLITDSQLFAERIAPAKVAPIQDGPIQYSLARQNPKSNLRHTVGVIEAWNTETKTRLWWRQIYATKFEFMVEADAQYVCINKMVLLDQRKKPFTQQQLSERIRTRNPRIPTYLYVTNDRNQKFYLNLKTLQVQTIPDSKKK